MPGRTSVVRPRLPALRIAAARQRVDRLRNLPRGGTATGRHACQPAVPAACGSAAGALQISSGSRSRTPARATDATHTTALVVPAIGTGAAAQPPPAPARLQPGRRTVPIAANAGLARCVPAPPHCTAVRTHGRTTQGKSVRCVCYPWSGAHAADRGR
ncbi:hypothetical protein G6F22_011494 [Rhizopus arrhizus]|nr:hypothetical protein G6F22_011494 [Rhizopus arrhizus]KAG1398585.1 hypothetical protein G6F59_013453 [Rhizopus arrhizus]